MKDDERMTTNALLSGLESIVCLVVYLVSMAENGEKVKQ